MLSLPPSVRVFVARAPVDMRRSIDGLAAAVIDVVDEDPQLCGGPRYVAGKGRSIRVTGACFILARWGAT